jgi:hypothetical protein
MEKIFTIVINSREEAIGYIISFTIVYATGYNNGIEQLKN